MTWQTVIGLEIHVQLATKTKLFCGCSLAFGDAPNSHTCPTCLGLPGSLPILNKGAVDKAILAALGLECNIQEFSKFDRKTIFYPDMPKAFQTTQLDLPYCLKGGLEIPLQDGNSKFIELNRIHIEEDAGKSIHDHTPEYSCIDLNRAGTPLVEIVTEPCIETAKEATTFLNRLRMILIYLGVSDCEMSQGNFRCDANVSIRKAGEKLGNKTEIKNMNSFSNIEDAINYEIKRHKKVLEKGGKIEEETRLWDVEKKQTRAMRSKEAVNDYRYFPEPDLPPLIINQEWINKIKSTMVELPYKKEKRFVEEYNLPQYDAEVLIQDRLLADYFENVVAKINGKPKEASNWIMGEINRWLKELKKDITSLGVDAKNLAELINLVGDDTISNQVAKQVLEMMIQTGKSAKLIVDEKGLAQESNTEELISIINKIIDANPAPLEDFKSGNKKAAGFYVGQVMKASKGKANPKIVNQVLMQELSKR